MTDNDIPRRAEDDAAGWYARLNAADDPAERQRFALWHAESSANARAWARLERTATLLARAEGHPALAAMRAEARQPRLPAMSSAAFAPSRPSRFYGRLALASLALIAGVGALSLWPHVQAGFAPQQQGVTPSVTRYATAVGERKTVQLPDGSTVMLDTDSAISLPAWDKKAGTKRHVTLERGQALFAVAKDRAHPFVVTSAGRAVEALGTTFTVRDDEARFSVALLEGKVAVSFANAVNRPAILQPGDTLVQESSAITLRHNAAADMVDWTNGRLIFDEAPLRQIVDEMNRYSSRKIELADDALATRPFSGTFATDGTEALIEALKAYKVARIITADANRIVIGTR